MLLAISFLVNGLAAAGAHPAQTDRQECEHATMVVDHAAMEHADHQETMGSLQVSAGDQAPANDGCCEGMSCQCGCALPTAVILPSITLAPQVAAGAPSIQLVAHAVTRRSTAPFRPPSV